MSYRGGIRWARGALRGAGFTLALGAALALGEVLTGPPAANAAPCVGDCNWDPRQAPEPEFPVGVSEGFLCVKMANRVEPRVPASMCVACDMNGDGQVVFEEGLTAWFNVLSDSRSCIRMPTHTPTATPSATPTFTPTAVATPTATDTATHTLTPTSTQTATNTATATPTHSATGTATATATLSVTPIPTHTPTNSATATPTHTATSGPTLSATITPTATQTPRRFFAYVANSLDNTVSVIDTALRRVIATVPVGTQPENVVASPEGDVVYVASFGQTGLSGSVSVISVASNRVVPPTIVPVDTGKGTRGVAFVVPVTGPIRDVLVTQAGTSNALFRIDKATQRTSASISGGSFADPYDIVIDNERDTAFVSNSATVGRVGEVNSVTILRISDLTPLRKLSVGTNPRGMAFSRALGVVLVANFESDNMSIVASREGSAPPDVTRILATVSVGDGPQDIDLTPDEQYALVANVNGRSVSIVDVEQALTLPTSAVVATVPIGELVRGVAVTPDGRFAYVTDGPGGEVTVFDIGVALVDPPGSIVARIPVGRAPRGIDMVPPADD